MSATQLLQKKSLRLRKYVVVGIAGTVLKLGLMFLLTDVAGIHYLVSYALTFVVVVTTKYIGNSLWTFRDRRNSTRGLGKYALLSCGALVINELFIWYLTDILGLWYMLSTALVILAMFLVTFALSSKLVWKDSK